MKPRGSNTGCGSKHLGKGYSASIEAPLPRLLPLSRPEISAPQRVLGVRRASQARSLGVSLPPVRGRQPGVYRVQGLGRETALSLPSLNRAGGPEGDAGSCGSADALLYALRRSECASLRRWLARPDSELPLLRGHDRRRKGLLGSDDGRRDGQAAQEVRTGSTIQQVSR